MIIDDDDWLDSDNPSFMKLKEQYANCEIDSSEYIQKRNQFNEEKNNTALRILKERYAKGEISSEEFQQIYKNIL